MDPLNGLAHRGPLPTPTRPRAPTSSLRGLSLLHFPCPRPASVYANPRGGGNICLASAPHFLSRWESGGECGGAGPTRRHAAADRLRWSQLQPPAPYPSPNHFESQEAEDAPDMPLCLSPSRLDGPHFSCLVSRGPGGQLGLGSGETHVAHRDLPASVSPSASSCPFVFLTFHCYPQAPFSPPPAITDDFSNISFLLSDPGPLPPMGRSRSLCLLLCVSSSMHPTFSKSTSSFFPSLLDFIYFQKLSRNYFRHAEYYTPLPINPQPTPRNKTPHICLKETPAGAPSPAHPTLLQLEEFFFFFN